MTVTRSNYWGLGVIIAPKSNEYTAGLVINFLCWEFNFRWGFSKLEEKHIEELNNKIKTLYKKD